MTRMHRRRLAVTVLILLCVGAALVSQQDIQTIAPVQQPETPQARTAITELAELPVKGRAPKTGYARNQFGDGWRDIDGCDTRNIILARDLDNEQVDDACKVITGVLHDPYTGTTIQFQRGPTTSDDVQIDHVVALSNAWQTGAQALTFARREQLANDPLNLLAVDGAANQQKSDGDAATWLPKNTSFRCQYIRRQMSVKAKYHLWVTPPEKEAMQRVLSRC